MPALRLRFTVTVWAETEDPSVDMVEPINGIESIIAATKNIAVNLFI
jgi:hypothetical protein